MDPLPSCFRVTLISLSGGSLKTPSAIFRMPGQRETLVTALGRRDDA